MSRTAFDRAIAFVLPHEEEFVRGHWGDENYVTTENVSGDSGGLTKYGIDQASHPHVDIAALTKDAAIMIYYGEWEKHELDSLPDKLAIAAFDVWVNGGHANLWLQSAYNRVENNRAPLEEDGVLGPVSLAAFNSCTPAEINSMIDQFIKERDARFEQLAQTPSRAKFLAGWEQRDADLRAYIQSV